MLDFDELVGSSNEREHHLLRKQLLRDADRVKSAVSEGPLSRGLDQFQFVAFARREQTMQQSSAAKRFLIDQQDAQKGEEREHAAG